MPHRYGECSVRVFLPLTHLLARSPTLPTQQSYPITPTDGGNGFAFADFSLLTVVFNRTEPSHVFSFWAVFKQSLLSVNLCTSSALVTFMYSESETHQIAASLMQAHYLAVIKSISGCVRIACSGLMITSLLQVVNRQLIVKTFYSQVWCKFQQLVASLQISSWINCDFHNTIKWSF